MIKIKYVGVKHDGERAFKEDTGIEWFPGDVNEVSAENAAKMLRHPDVFVQVTGEPVKPADAPVLKQVAHDQDEVDDEAIAREAAAKKAKEDVEAAAAAKAAAEGDDAGAKKAEAKPEPEVQVKKPAKKAAKKSAKKAAK